MSTGIQNLSSLEMEMSVLGSILLRKEAIFEVCDYLTPNDFYKTDHQKIYSAALKLYKTGKGIDLIMIAEELQKTNVDIASTYLAALTNTVATATRIKQYATVVKDRSLRRQLLFAQAENDRVINNLEEDIETVLAKSQSSIFKINSFGTVDDGIATIIKELEETQEMYAQKYKEGQKYIGYKCGIEKIDNLIDGIRPGHVWVVGAWTSIGKTQFALNLVHNILEQNVPVTIVSLEMSRVDLAARLIGIRHNISSMRVLKGKSEAEIVDKVDEGKRFLSQTPLEIHTTYFDLEKIKMLIRKDVYNRKVKFVVVDYVQNVISEKGLREYELMTAAATDLQALARELGITVYIVSQISNDSEKGNGAGAGFKGTGALEAVADLAIRLKRDKSKESADDNYVPVDIIVTKNRHGYTGKISDYSMWLKSGKFEEMLVPSGAVKAKNPTF